MLTLTVSLDETFNEEDQTFGKESYELELEHSLVSVSKWEARFEKPFLADKEKTTEETLWYIQAMSMAPNVPPEVFSKLSVDQIAEINLYIGAKMTATTFHDMAQPRQTGEFVTNEIIYYWMVELGIEWEAQWWHLNRLLTLIRVINLKRAPKKKRINKAEAAQERRKLNEQRKAELGTRG